MPKQTLEDRFSDFLERYGFRLLIVVGTAFVVVTLAPICLILYVNHRPAWDSLEEIGLQMNDPVEKVIAVMGKPDDVFPNGNSEDWRYFKRLRHKETGQRLDITITMYRSPLTKELRMSSMTQR